MSVVASLSSPPLSPLALLHHNTPMPYYGFPPLLRRGFTYGHERIEDILEELRPMHSAHWAETEHSYNGGECSPDYKGLVTLEADSHMVQFTVRAEDQELIGQLVYRIARSFHAPEHLQAIENAFYVKPEWRGVGKGGVGLHLLDYAEDGLRHLGVTMFTHMDKSPMGGVDMSRTFKRRGYKPIYVGYIKTVEEMDHG